MFKLLNTDFNELFREIVGKVMRGLNSITESFPILIYQFIAILIVCLVIKHFFWGKITNYLEAQRYKMIKDRLQSSKDRYEASLLKEEQKQAFTKMKEENNVIREQIKHKALLEAEKIKDAAKEQAHQRLLKVEQEIQQEIKESEEKIKQIISEVSYAAAQKILQKELNHSKYDHIIEDVTKEIIENKKQDGKD